MKTNKYFGMEVTEIQDYTGKYCDLKAPEGFRKIEVWELWRILDSSFRDEFLGEYKEKHNSFLCEQTKYDKENNRSRWLFLDRDMDLDSDWDNNLANSDYNGKVVFVKAEKDDEDKRIKCIYCKNFIHIDNFAGVTKKGLICNNICCLTKLAEEEKDEEYKGLFKSKKI